jgi:ABC-type multidrug transport system fused ATPase/permease subunit
MGMVFQQFNLFPHMTVLKNMTISPIKVLGLSKQEAEERAMKLLERVGLADRANAYPSQLSGGQKQRLCIARALLRKPKILILDDSTSAVDMKTDALIRKAFAEEIPDTTKIIIAQRVASVEHADKIIILDGGKIVAFGNHAELLETSEIYREIYDAQTKSRSVEEKKGEKDHE